jgi:site-specific DNA recombinase
MHASKGRDHTCLVAGIDHGGRGESYRVVELRPMPPDVPGRMNGTQGQEHMAPLLAIGTQRSRQQISCKIRKEALMQSSSSSVMNLTSDVRFAAIYVRVSTEDQGKGFSIPTQIDACQQLATREAYIVPESHVLRDEGISGTTLDRPGLHRLRELVQARAIAAVIVIDPDRLSRNLGHELLLAEELEQAGVQLVIVSHPLERGPEGWLFFQMRGALAEYERAKLLERTQRGRIGRAKAGHPWGQVPFGYRAIREPHGGRWEIDPEEAAMVRRMFAMCLQGLSTRAIARQLTLERVPTKLDREPKGGRRRTLGPGCWSPPMVHHMLTYEGYIGRTYWGKRQSISQTQRRARPKHEWIALTIPAIIDEETFQATQAQLQRNRALAKRNRKHDYLFGGGRFRCGRCGRGMTGFPLRGVRYCRCNGRNQVMDPEQRCRGSLQADVIEARIWAAVERVLQQPDMIAAEVTQQQAGADERRAMLEQDIEVIEASLAKCDREAQRWADAYAAEVISLPELKEYRSEIATRRQQLQVRRAGLHAEMEAIGQTSGYLESLISYCTQVRQRLQTFDESEKRLALEALDIRISWTPNEPLTIQGSIPLSNIVPVPSGGDAPPCGPRGRGVPSGRSAIMRCSPYATSVCGLRGRLRRSPLRLACASC